MSGPVLVVANDIGSMGEDGPSVQCSSPGGAGGASGGNIGAGGAGLKIGKFCELVITTVIFVIPFAEDATTPRQFVPYTNLHWFGTAVEGIPMK